MLPWPAMSSSVKAGLRAVGRPVIDEKNSCIQGWLRTLKCDGQRLEHAVEHHSVRAKKHHGNAQCIQYVLDRANRNSLSERSNGLERRKFAQFGTVRQPGLRFVTGGFVA